MRTDITSLIRISLRAISMDYIQLEFDTVTPSSTVHKLDMVQRRAARYTCNRYHNISREFRQKNELGDRNPSHDSLQRACSNKQNDTNFF